MEKLITNKRFKIMGLEYNCQYQLHIFEMKIQIETTKNFFKCMKTFS